MRPLSKPTAKSKSQPAEGARVQRIGTIVNQLISRRGYAQVAVVHEMESTITATLDESIRGSIRVGNLKRGVLEVYAGDSVTLQELNFQKRSILRKIEKEHPQSNVTDLRFRIQAR